MEYSFGLYDLVRVDHFRGFDEYYNIPYGDETAENGVWEKGPGIEIFRRMEEYFGTKQLPIVAEDLGFLTPSVHRLLKESGFPGMKVLEFAFEEGGSSPYLPHNYTSNCVVYTGTHDNETVAGWYRSILPEERAAVCRYLHRDAGAVEPLHWDFVCTAMASVGRWCIIPLQDYLGLDNRARINHPSTLGENWRWRVDGAALTPELAGRIRAVTETYGRLPAGQAGTKGGPKA